VEDCRRFFGDLLDHHGLQSVGAVVEKSPWRAIMDWQTRRMVCLRCSMFFINWMAAVIVLSRNCAHRGRRHHAPTGGIGGTETELRHVVFVEKRLPLIVDLAEINVRLDQAGLRLVVAKSRTGIEFLDYI